MIVQDEEKPSSLEHLKKGRLTPGDNEVNSANELPAWVNKEKIERAKKLYSDYATCIRFGQLSGLMMIFLYTKNIEPFLFTGQSSNFVSLLRRYVATADHVHRWYTGDIWNPEDDAHKSLMVVKNMHKNVAKKMNDDKPPSKDFLYVSQFSMAMTQFAFAGLIILFPQKLGIVWNKEDTECFIHFWRSVGYLLGIDDKYNICAGNYEETLTLFKDILDNEMKPGIQNPHYESVKMARDIITVFSSFLPLLTWQSLCEYWADFLTIPRDFTLSLYDKISLNWYYLAFGILLNYKWIRFLFNYRNTNTFYKILNNMPYYESIVLRYEEKITSKTK